MYANDTRNYLGKWGISKIVDLFTCLSMWKNSVKNLHNVKLHIKNIVVLKITYRHSHIIRKCNLC